MICVEAGHVSSPVILLPGTAFEASQILQVSRDVHFTYQSNLNVIHYPPIITFSLFNLRKNRPGDVSRADGVRIVCTEKGKKIGIVL